MYIGMRKTLGFTGQKDPMKRDGSAISVKITLCGAAARKEELCQCTSTRGSRKKQEENFWC